MVVTETHTQTFPHPFCLVTLAVLSKYPHPSLPQVHAVDVIHRHISPSGTLLSRRLFTGATPVPPALRWMVRDGEHAYAVEDSEVDPARRVMTQRMRSVTLAGLVEIRETCTYAEHPVEKGWTTFRQEWECEWKKPKGMTGTLERLSAERFLRTRDKGSAVVAEICEKLRNREECATSRASVK
mmetsp:Transcript_23290/g.57824  ORF Transcript_23290/g.57824 Transcript_23290/m.57824 type:complete len:183 (-) Transcript_23290:1138-1686(-)